MIKMMMMAKVMAMSMKLKINAKVMAMAMKMKIMIKKKKIIIMIKEKKNLFPSLTLTSPNALANKREGVRFTNCHRHRGRVKLNYYRPVFYLSFFPLFVGGMWTLDNFLNVVYHFLRWVIALFDKWLLSRQFVNYIYNNKYKHKTKKLYINIIFISSLVHDKQTKN